MILHGQHRDNLCAPYPRIFHDDRTISTAGREGDGWRSFWRRFGGRRALIDGGCDCSQSAKTTESGGPRGYGGKKVKGRKRHLVVDTEGNPLTVQIHAAAFRIGTAHRSNQTCRRCSRWGLLGPETCGVPARLAAWTRNLMHRFQAAGKQGFCGSPPPLGGGTDFCLAEPLPTIGQGLRANHRERQGVGALDCGAALGPPPRAAHKCLCNNGLNGLAKVLIQTLRRRIQRTAEILNSSNGCILERDTRRIC